MKNYIRSNAWALASLVAIIALAQFGLMPHDAMAGISLLAVGSTSPTITTAFKTQFSDTFIAALAQTESRLQGAVTDRGSIQGSSFTINNVGTVEMSEVTGRYQDKTPTNVDHATRIAYMADYDVMVPVDRFDVAKLVADPTYKYVELLKGAANRKKDQVIYRAMVDSVMQRTSEGGALSGIAVPSTQIITAGGTAFTKAKIIQANSMFRANECDSMNGEELYIVYNSDMVRTIFSDTTLTSADYLAKQMLESGKVLDNWLGFNWIPYEKLDIPAANTKRAVAWAKSGIQYGTGIDTVVDVDVNKSKRGNPTETYAMLSLGAARQDDKKVVVIDFTY